MCCFHTHHYLQLCFFLQCIEHLTGKVSSPGSYTFAAINKQVIADAFQLDDTNEIDPSMEIFILVLVHKDLASMLNPWYKFIACQKLRH